MNERCSCPGGIDIDGWPVTIDPNCPKHNRKEKYVVLHLPEDPVKKRLEALELVASCAKDVVDYWPSMSFRTIRVMIPKMQALKEALQMLV